MGSRGGSCRSQLGQQDPPALPYNVAADRAPTPLTLLIDLVLLVSGLVLWRRGSSEGDDVWSMFLRTLAVIDLVVIALSNGLLWIEIPLLIGALCLPSVARLEGTQRTKS